MKDKKLSSKLPWIVGGSLTVAVIILAFLSAGEPACFESSKGIISCPSKWFYLKQSTPNELGDTLAGFAGTLAFIWIIVTVWIQSIELSDSRKVLGEQRDEFEKQNEGLRQQVFENTFFQMLSTYSEIVAAIDFEISGTGKKVDGKESLNELARRLHLAGKKGSYSSQEYSDFWEINEKFWTQYRGKFGHYYRFLYNFFRLIEESEHAKDYHSRILRSCLSDNELFLLFYNSLSAEGVPFQRYVNAYSLFDNLPINILVSQEHLSAHSRLSYVKNFDAMQFVGVEE